MNRKRPPLLISLVLLCLCHFAAAEQPFSFAKTPGKLPKTIVPSEYSIVLTPDIEAGKFEGFVEVSAEVMKPATEIVVNSLGLKIVSAKIEGEGGGELAVKLDEAAQTLTLTPKTPLPKGKLTFNIKYTGTLNEQPQGLYLCRYQKDGKDRKGLATQFEPADARRMVPCWDEPVFRAKMHMHVILPKGLTVVSNMPEMPGTEGPGSSKMSVKVFDFAPTPPMPTYLLALFAGEFDKLEDTTDGVKLGFYTPPGKAEQARYVMEITKEILHDYGDYFGTKYPLPKLDQVALPNTGAGGMENWGAIVYREDAMLFDPATSSQAQKERVYSIVAHEIAHQWFGDLVTMAWWDNLWLNEGFASWMSTKQMALRHSNWKPWLRAAGGKESAMRLDARSTTHSIQMPVRTESEAGDVFDEITYQKGQAVIRMLESWLGEDVFRSGIRAYMQKHAFSNTTTADLWAALADASKKDVASFAAGWTEQPGFPVVQVSSFPRDNAPRATVWQQRFTVQQRDAVELYWMVPVWYGPAGNPQDALLLLLERKIPQGLNIPAEGAVKANMGGVGYYRVQYQDWIFKRLFKSLPYLSEADRLNLLQDTWALVEADRVPPSDYLRLAETVADTASPTELEQIIGVLWQMDRMGRDAGLNAERLGRLRAWGLGLLRPHLERVGWTATTSESTLVTQLRPKLLALAGAYGDPETLRLARANFVRWFSDPKSVEADLRGTVLTIIGRETDAMTWDQILRIARRTTSSEQKRELYTALATTSDPKLAAQALALALTHDLPPRDATRLVGRVADAGRQPEAAWEFASKNLEALYAKLTAHQANEYVPNLFTYLPATEARAVELEAWAAKNLPPGAGPSVAKAADEIRFQAAFRKRVLPEIEAWVKAKK